MPRRRSVMRELDNITGAIVDASLRIHRDLGPGLVESGVDLVADDWVIVEVKRVEQLTRAHPKQLLTYLKLTNRQVGLLINFGAPTLREGLRRIVNGFPSSAPSRLRVNQIVVDRAMRQRY
jgi:iron complex transport system substrate-binding protein